MLKYEKLSQELQNKINQEIFDGNGFLDPAIRRNPTRDKATLWRGAFVRDAEKIMHSPYYNRYADKTQVFSFYKNDDISHRALHVQLVSRIARNIGRLLGLNLDLIESIAAIFANYPEISTEIIAASIRNPIHVTDCALAGADIATVPYNVIEQMTKHPLTEQGIEKFQKDYIAVFGE